MFHRCRFSVLGSLLPVLALLVSITFSAAQELRYEPSQPTVSPYLQLFQQGRNNAVPNYYTFVRPLQSQQQINSQQQRRIQRQSLEIGLLQSTVQTLEERQAEGPLIAPTGHASWFSQPGTRARFLDTSRYYSYLQSGTVQRR